MKKSICLLPILVLAAIASAADIDVYDGAFHSPYVSGPQPPYDQSGLRWYEWFFDHTHPVDGLPTARVQGLGLHHIRVDGATWNPNYNPPTTLSLAGNRFLEFDGYFYHGNSRIPGTYAGDPPAYRTGVNFDTMYLQVNSDNGLTYKWDTGVDMWVDDVYYSDMGAWAADPNTWVHIKIDLLSNSAPATQIDVGSDTVGLIRLNMPVTVDFHVRNAKFTGAGTVNIAPSVNAGQNQTITSPVCEITLNGSVTDDGLPDPPAQVNCTWDMVSGPAAVAFGNVFSPTTTATFSAVGIYELRLTASDGELTRSDTLTMTVQDYSADLNDDGFVDFSDLGLMADRWLQAGGKPSADIHPAPTPDGIVNLSDYSKWAALRDSVIECGTGQAISNSVNVSAMVNEAVAEARAAYGSGKPKVILVAEQIDNNGSVILPALQSEFGADVPICGVHILWNDYTPFTMDSFPNESQSYKSVAVMALGGGITVQTAKADGIIPDWEPDPYDEALQCGYDLAMQFDPDETANNLILVMGARHGSGVGWFIKGVREALTGDPEGLLPDNIRVIGWGTMDETDDVYFNSQRYFHGDLPDGSSVVGVMLSGDFDWAISGQVQSGDPAGSEPYTGWANAVTEISGHIDTVVSELGGIPDATFFIPAHPGRDKFAAIEAAVEGRLGSEANLFGWHAASETGHDSTSDGYAQGVGYHFFVAGIKGGSSK